MTQNPKYPLGGFDWLDTKASLRRWFANWLTITWTHIYSESLHQLHTKEDWKAYGALEKFIKTFPAKLGHLSTSKQLAALDAKARKWNFKTTRQRVEDELRIFLTRTGQQKNHAAAFKASPWCNHFATKEHILEQAGKRIPYKCYPNDPDAWLALESVISEFGSFEILRGESTVMSQLFAMQRSFDQFDTANKSLPAESPLLSAFGKIEPELRDYSATLQAEIDLHVKEPAAFVTPLRVRRLQRRLYFAVRRLCAPKGGSDNLAAFILSLLKQWPYIPAGMAFDLQEHFSVDNRHKFVRDHLGLAKGEMNKEGRALLYVLQAIVFRDELRGSLLRLAHDADMRAHQRRKGWDHLRHALKTVFTHIRHEASDEAKFRNFERANFPNMRSLTREQRMLLLPELGNDPDSSIRDLTKSERMILAARYLNKTQTALKHDADGKSSFAVRYGRAMKAVRKELQQD